MRQLDQRVAMRCRLESLSKDEVARYIDHRLGIAGGASARASLTPTAIAEVHEVTRGVPRLINLLCDRALHESWIERAEQAGIVHVRNAARWLGLTSHDQHQPESATVKAAPVEPLSVE